MDMTPRQRHIFVILAWVALAVYFALVAWVCFGTFKHLPDMTKPIFWDIGKDKLIHFTMFFPFPILVMFTRRERPSSVRKAVFLTLLCLLIGLAAAGGTELTQGNIPNRQPSWYDFLADALGLLLSSLIVLVISIRQARRSA